MKVSNVRVEWSFFFKIMDVHEEKA